MTLTYTKSSTQFWGTNVIMLKKLPLNNRPMGGKFSQSGKKWLLGDIKNLSVELDASA
jgi:hypothetical protein